MEHKKVDARLKDLTRPAERLDQPVSDCWRGAEAAHRGEVHRQGLIINYVLMINSMIQATNVVGWRRQLEKSKLKPGTRAALDMTTLTIMRYLPREVDPLVYNMSHEDPGDVSYSGIGGLGEQIR